MAASTLAGAVRRAKGFARFAVSVQYHGGSFLGFTYQGPHKEDCVVEQRKTSGSIGRVDLRGKRSVEGRLREALDDLFGKHKWENIQASSRTDRGVHALKNTFHVDVKVAETSNDRNDDNSSKLLQQPPQTPTLHESIERKLKDGLNFYLSRQSHGFDTNHPKGRQNPMMNEMRILNASKSPEYMDNPYALTEEGKAKKQTFQVDWNARFSATQRTYVYRILCYCPRKEKQSLECNPQENRSSSSSTSWHSYGIPFEWDRAWCLPQSQAHPLNVEIMKEAAAHFVGTHDFSSFRGRLCHRKSPIVTMEKVTIEECHPVAGDLFAGTDSKQQEEQQQKLVTITFVGNSFLYRQVRNMVGCLVEVGKHGGGLSPNDVQYLLSRNWKESENEAALSKSRFKHRPYSTAPPQGLFLVDVQHGTFRF